MSHFIFDARTATDRFPGIGRYVRELTSALMPLLTADEKVTMLSNPAGSATWDALQPRAGDARPPRAVPVSSSPFSIEQQWRIPLLLRRLRAGEPTLYHSPYYVMPYLPGLPTVLTFYDITPLRYPQDVPLKARLFFRLATTLAMRAASRVVVVSEAARNDLTRSFPRPLVPCQCHTFSRRFPLSTPAYPRGRPHARQVRSTGLLHPVRWNQQAAQEPANIDRRVRAAVHPKRAPAGYRRRLG